MKTMYISVPVNAGVTIIEAMKEECIREIREGKFEDARSILYELTDVVKTYNKALEEQE